MQDKTNQECLKEGLLHRRASYRELFENATMGIFHSLPEGRFRRANHALATMLGYRSPEEMIAAITDIATQVYVDGHKRSEILTRARQGDWTLSEVSFRRKDGAIMTTNLTLRSVNKADGTIDYLEGFVEDITGRKEAEEERETMVDVLHLINLARSTSELIGLVCSFLRKRFQCDAIGIRFQCGEDFPYFETSGFPQEFVARESSLCAAGEEQVANFHCEEGKPLLECFCGAILSGQFDPSKPCFTEHGSFWTGNATELLEDTALLEDIPRLRGRCPAAGYESMALIPLRVRRRVLGLLQLNDAQKNAFSANTIASLERMADNFAIALARLQAEEALQTTHAELEQRVAERTAELVTANNKLNREIEEHKSTETLLQKSKATLQMVFDGIAEPLIMLNQDMQVRMINRAAKDYYGLDEYQPVLGKTCFTGLRAKATPCAGCPQPFSYLEDYTGSFERRSPMDPSRLERVVVYRVTDESGGEAATIVRIGDITHSKQMERQLIQSEKLASLGLLISGIAHEINNPNNFISFNIPILKDYLEVLIPIIDRHAAEHADFEPFGMTYPEFREDLFKLMENMEHGSNRINATVSGLKEFVRKRENVERHQVEIGNVVERVVMLCRSEVKKRVRSFQVSIPEAIAPFFSDPEALEQILVNLLINATHAVDKEDSRIRLAVHSGDPQVHSCVIEVSDNGSGMDEATRQKIFDPFFTTKPAGQGTGLGLSLCHNLVEGLGGSIEVESEPGVGTTFKVILYRQTDPRVLDSELLANTTAAGYTKEAK